MKNQPDFSIVRNSIIPVSCRIMSFVNIYDAQLGEDVMVGPFTELGGCVIGDRTKVSSHSYVCPHVTIGTDCFIGHSVAFTNDLFESPKSYSHIDELASQWTPRRTEIGNNVRIGSGAVILPVKIGNGCIIGAGSVVTKDMADGEIWAGNPAKKLR